MNPTVDELQRAWRALQAGEFRPGSRASRHGVHPSHERWTPSAAERVLPVVGAGGSVGATTLALALATAHGGPARVVECSPASTSGLAAAAFTELGADPTGWVRGTRDWVVLERSPGTWASAADIGVPAAVEGAVFTVIDAGSDAAPRAGWLAALLQETGVVVVVARATVPGLRRLELQLTGFTRGRTVVTAVLGPPRKRWPRDLTAGAGPLTRRVDDAGLLVPIPVDRDLADRGLTPAPLPTPVVAAATTVWNHVEGTHA